MLYDATNLILLYKLFKLAKKVYFFTLTYLLYAYADTGKRTKSSGAKNLNATVSINLLIRVMMNSRIRNKAFV